MVKIEEQKQQSLQTNGPSCERERLHPELETLFSYSANKEFPFFPVKDLTISLTSGKAYRLLRELGKGEDGRVVLASREGDEGEEFFAIKLFRPVTPLNNKAFEERMSEKRQAYRAAKDEYWAEGTSEERKEELNRQLGGLEFDYDRSKDNELLEVLRYRRILREIAVLKSMSENDSQAPRVRVPAYEEAKFLFHPDSENQSKLGVLVMEYVPDASNLRDYLKEMKPEELTPEHSKNLISSFVAITRGLERLSSRGILQSDFYFEQVLVTPEKLSEPVLIDFARSLMSDLLEKQPSARGFAYDPDYKRNELQAKSIDIEDKVNELCEKLGYALSSELGTYKHEHAKSPFPMELELVEELGRRALYRHITISELGDHLEEILDALALTNPARMERLQALSETFSKYHEQEL